MDDSLKKQAEYLLDDMGLNMTTAVTMYMKAIVHNRKIPFEITAEDPFYSEENQRHLSKAIADLEAGKGQVHELIEVDDE
jgi:DNA-damage-inducible protein J